MFTRLNFLILLLLNVCFLEALGFENVNSVKNLSNVFMAFENEMRNISQQITSPKTVISERLISWGIFQNSNLTFQMFTGNIFSVKPDSICKPSANMLYFPSIALLLLNWVNSCVQNIAETNMPTTNLSRHVHFRKLY